METTTAPVTPPLTELIQISEPVIIQRGEKYLEDQKKLDEMIKELALMQIIMEDRDAFKKENEDLKKELERLRTEALENSIAVQVARNHCRDQKEKIDSLSDFSETWLQEFEERFRIEKQADSPAIAEHYIKHALYMEERFGRDNHSVEEVQAWIDGDNLPY